MCVGDVGDGIYGAAGDWWLGKPARLRFVSATKITTNTETIIGGGDTELHQAIHSKSEQIGGDLLLSTEKLAEKVRISGRQNFATNMRLS